MNRSILGRAAFSAAVALALGFGARQAVAAPKAEAVQPYCRDGAHCLEICTARHPGEEVWVECSAGHTCYCYLF